LLGDVIFASLVRWTG